MLILIYSDSMPARVAGINLLPKTEFDLSYWGRFLKWSITTGRYILILVEMIVILAFLSRFKLDKDLADLSQSISGKKAILDNSYAAEQHFRQVQGRLNSAQELLQAQVGTRHVLDVVTSYVPPDVTLAQVEVQPHLVHIAGKSTTQTGLAVFLARMTTDHSWQSIELTDVSATPDKMISFAISATK